MERIFQSIPNEALMAHVVNPLNSNFFSLQTTFSPHMPPTHLISISVQALTPKLHPCPTSGLNKQSRDFDHTHSEPKQPFLLETSLLQGESSVF